TAKTTSRPNNRPYADPTNPRTTWYSGDSSLFLLRCTSTDSATARAITAQRMRTRRITASAGGWPRSRAILTSDHPSVKEPERRSRRFTPRRYARSIGRADDRARGRRRSWHSGHVGRVFSGVSSFESQATTYLAQRAARGERQMFLVDSPVVDQWPKDLLDRGALVVASVTEIYGPDRTVAATSQRDTFAAELAEALSEGYTGIRVAADNSSLVDTPE